MLSLIFAAAIVTQTQDLWPAQSGRAPVYHESDVVRAAQAQEPACNHACPHCCGNAPTPQAPAKVTPTKPYAPVPTPVVLQPTASRVIYSAPTYRVPAYYGQTYYMGGSSCANGQCATPASGGFRLFRGR